MSKLATKGQKTVGAEPDRITRDAPDSLVVDKSDENVNNQASGRIKHLTQKD